MNELMKLYKLRKEVETIDPATNKPIKKRYTNFFLRIAIGDNLKYIAVNPSSFGKSEVALAVGRTNYAYLSAIATEITTLEGLPKTTAELAPF